MQHANFYDLSFQTIYFSSEPTFHYHPPAFPQFPSPFHTQNESNEISGYSTVTTLSSERLVPTPLSQPTTSAPVPGSPSQPKRKRPFKCPRCSKTHERISRANACINRHRKARPYACNGSCGNPNWLVDTTSSLPDPFTNSILSQSAYNSIETLHRHRLPSSRKEVSCPNW